MAYYHIPLDEFREQFMNRLSTSLGHTESARREVLIKCMQEPQDKDFWSNEITIEIALLKYMKKIREDWLNNIFTCLRDEGEVYLDEEASFGTIEEYADWLLEDLDLLHMVVKTPDYFDELERDGESRFDIKVEQIKDAMPDIETVQNIVDREVAEYFAKYKETGETNN